MFVCDTFVCVCLCVFVCVCVCVCVCMLFVCVDGCVGRCVGIIGVHIKGHPVSECPTGMLSAWRPWSVSISSWYMVCADTHTQHARTHTHTHLEGDDMFHDHVLRLPDYLEVESGFCPT